MSGEECNHVYKHGELKGPVPDRLCEGCRASFMKAKSARERYLRLEQMPIIGPLRRIPRRLKLAHRKLVAERARRFRTRCTDLLNVHPVSRILYPLMQMIVWQLAWIVSSEEKGTKWYIERDSETVARHYGEYQDFEGTATVRRPFGSGEDKFTVTYDGGGEYGATLEEESVRPFPVGVISVLTIVIQAAWIFFHNLDYGQFYRCCPPAGEIHSPLGIFYWLQATSTATLLPIEGLMIMSFIGLVREWPFWKMIVGGGIWLAVLEGFVVISPKNYSQWPAVFGMGAIVFAFLTLITWFRRRKRRRSTN